MRTLLTLGTATQPELVLDRQTRALLGAVEAEPHAPMTLGIQAPGGYGKTLLLRALERIYRQAGVTVIDAWQDLPERAGADCVLLVDDAHLLDDARLVQLRTALAAGPRLIVAYRPWPRPPAIAELTEPLKRAGQPLLLPAFTRDRIAAYLRLLAGGDVRPATVEFVHAQTAGIPRLVDRLARALLAADNPAAPDNPAAAPAATAGHLPPAAVLPFTADLDGLDGELRRLLLAAAADVDLPIDLLGPLLSPDPDAMDALLAAARATGLLGPDDRLPPLAKRAVAALSPAAQRIAVWQRLAEFQLRRGGRVLPLVRPLLRFGTAGGPLGAVFEAAGDEALATEPALAAELFAAAAAAGRPTAARQARAAALAGDLDAALRLADRLVATDSPDRAAGATVAATALAHRGHLGRSAELYRWSGSAPSLVFGAIAALGTGHADELTRVAQHPPTDGPPTLLASAALLMARGARETLTGAPTVALSALVQAAALLEPAGQAVLLPDSPAALAALVAVHCGELEIGESVLDRALSAGTGGALMSRRHRLLYAWSLMMRGRTAAATECLARVTAGARLEPRDLLFATGLEVGIARRNSDLGGLHRSWAHAREALVRHPVDLFTLLPLGEFAIAAARLGEQARLGAHLHEARLLLDRLGAPRLWATPLHWSGLHAAILAEQPEVADEHVAALAAAAGHTRYASVVAVAAACWVDVLRGVVDPPRVEAAARGLHEVGLSWDGARLAGQAAIRTSDRRAMTTLLDCARVLQGRPASHKAPPDTLPEQVAPAAPAPAEGRLSEREQEVADLVLAGLTYKQIGDRLFISAKTVEHHVARMRQRLGCANRSELLARLRAMAADRAGDERLRAPWPRRPAE